MRHTHPVSALSTRLNWYQKAIDMMNGHIPREDSFNWPDGTIEIWQASTVELQNALDMLLDHDGKITVGQVYLTEDGKQIRTVLAIHEEYLLLEMRDADTGALSQYCVAYQPSFYQGCLVWQHGHYFIAQERFGCDPFQALCNAAEFMRGPKTVYLLLCDTTEGTFASVHHTYDEAVEELTQSLLNHSDINTLAEELGLPCTAESYLNNKDAFDEHGAEDFYWIEETTF